MELRTYTPEDWLAVQRFIDEHWRAGHPYTDRTLFDWQFRGFGPGSAPASRLMMHEGEIVGFLGGIPGEYFVDAQIVRGVVFDLWVIRPDYRNRALGLLLMRSIEQEFPTTCCLGVNLDVVRFYTQRGYAYADHLNRYVTPLNADAFARLLAAGDVCPSVDTIQGMGDAAIAPQAAPQPGALQSLYERTVEQAFRYGVHRSAAFWQWRYAESAGFEYLFWGAPEGEGVVIGRVERAISTAHAGADRIPILRLIELLPGSMDAWQGGTDAAFVRLLRGVLAWGAGQGCALADYQNSSARLAGLLAEAGLQDTGAGGVAAAAPNLFQPLRFKAAPINCVWRVPAPLNGGRDVLADDVYFVKSDDGMDRPNVWPTPASHLWAASPHGDAARNLPGPPHAVAAAR